LDPLIATLMLNDELDVIYEAPSLDKEYHTQSNHRKLLKQKRLDVRGMPLITSFIGPKTPSTAETTRLILFKKTGNLPHYH
jgi:hypothetical protein